MTHNVHFKEGIVQILILYQLVAPKKADPIVDMLGHVIFQTLKIDKKTLYFKVLNETWSNMSTMGSAFLGAQIRKQKV